MVLDRYRIKILGASLVILSALFIVLFLQDKEIPHVKVDATKIAFIIIFPQLFAGFSIFQTKFLSYFTYFKIFHRIFGYLLIGINIIISIFCIYFYIPYLNAIPEFTIIFHIYFGIIGLIIIPLKLFWVIKKMMAYNINTAILGISFAIIMVMMFITGALPYI